MARQFIWARRRPSDAQSRPAKLKTRLSATRRGEKAHGDLRISCVESSLSVPAVETVEKVVRFLDVSMHQIPCSCEIFGVGRNAPELVCSSTPIPLLLFPDVRFNYPNPQEPEITVTVQRAVACSNGVPTLLVRVLGVNSVDVAAKAGAEAVNPTGGSVPVGCRCIAPFLVPNCDPNHINLPGGNVNKSCDEGKAGVEYCINPAIGQVENPGPYSAGGVVGNHGSCTAMPLPTGVTSLPSEAGKAART